MKSFKIAIHSIVEVITNSSTVIYTYQGGSLEPAKELIKEVLKLMGENVDVDDAFEFKIEREDMEDCECSCEDCEDVDECQRDENLTITAKEERFEALAEKMDEFLNSVSSDASYG